MTKEEAIRKIHAEAACKVPRSPQFMADFAEVMIRHVENERYTRAEQVILDCIKDANACSQPQVPDDLSKSTLASIAGRLEAVISVMERERSAE